MSQPSDSTTKSSAFPRLRRWRAVLGIGVPPSTGMREALQWLMLARLGVLFGGLGMMVLHQIFRGESAGVGNTDFPHLFAYALLAGAFAFNLLNAAFLERLPTHWAVAAIHVAFDTILTSLWIYYSGGKETVFALLYLIQILTVALILLQKGALTASLLASFCFGWVLLHHPLPNGFLVWGAYSALFLTLGVVGGYLSEELLRTNERLKDKSRKMERLTILHERILSDLPTGLLTVDAEMRVNFINPAGEHILGVPRARAVGRGLGEIESGLLPFFSRIPTEPVTDEELEAGESASSDEHHRTFLETKSKLGETRLQQCVEVGQGARARILRGDVAELEADAGLGRLLDKAAPGGRVLLFQDVTKLLHLEERLKQNEKLAAVGQLAAGIAHEIRNPLASMSASIEMLRGSLPVDGSFRENQQLMEIAIREIDRLNRLVSEFLDFVKPEKGRLSPVALRELLQEIVAGAQRSKDFKAGVTINEQYEEVQALGNSEKLKQVIWNLVMNAVQAMQKNGAIEVGCAPVNNTRVKFWVQDQGQGMSEETLSHLYEPFFTTKDKGTGLGLATAYKIVEAHHGEIRVKSTVGVGTRFEIWLPRA